MPNLKKSSEVVKWRTSGRADRRTSVMGSGFFGVKEIIEVVALSCQFLAVFFIKIPDGFNGDNCIQSVLDYLTVSYINIPFIG